MNKKSIIKNAVKHNGMGGPGYVMQPVNNPTSVPNTNTGPSLQNQGLVASRTGPAISMPPVGQNLGKMIGNSMPKIGLPQKQIMKSAIRTSGLPRPQFNGRPSPTQPKPMQSNTPGNAVPPTQSPLNGNVGAQQAQQYNTQLGQNMQNAFNSTYKPTQ